MSLGERCVIFRSSGQNGSKREWRERSGLARKRGAINKIYEGGRKTNLSLLSHSVTRPSTCPLRNLPDTHRMLRIRDSTQPQQDEHSMSSNEESSRNRLGPTVRKKDRRHGGFVRGIGYPLRFPAIEGSRVSCRREASVGVGPGRRARIR